MTSGKPRLVPLNAQAAGDMHTRYRPASHLAVASRDGSSEGTTPDYSPPPVEIGAQDEVPQEGAKAPRRRSRWKRWVALTAAALGLLVVAYAAWVATSVAGFESKIYKPRPATSTPVRPVVAVRPSPSLTSAVSLPEPTGTDTPNPLAGLPQGRINILVMGTDKRPDDPDHYARSDTMILLNLDTVNHRVGALTIPRDLVAEVPGYGVNKINSAYLFGEYYQEPGGGQALAAETISQLFNVPIDYYLTINFEGFRKLIDMIGGVTIDVPYSLDDYQYPSDDSGYLYGTIHVHFDAGVQHMDGLTALRYARTRHADNDFMRSHRQLQVMVAARQSAMSVNLIPKLPGIIDQLSGMVETDIPFDKQVSLANFAYSLKSSDIYTATIGADLISAVTLKDGSEGLQLEWSAARPMLTEFFGRSDIGPVSTSAGSALQETPTSVPEDGGYIQKKSAVRPSPTPAAVRRKVVATPTQPKHKVTVKLTVTPGP